MTELELKALCIFMMCHDDGDYSNSRKSIDHRDEVMALANRTAMIYGYSDWIDAYHKL